MARTSSLRLASVPFDVLAVQEQDGIPLHVVPSQHPAFDEEHRQPSTTSSCYTRDAFILALTPFEDASVLEIRTFSLRQTSVNRTPHHLLFPAPLLPNIHIMAGDEGDEEGDEDTLTLSACTVTGYAYRIRLSLSILNSIGDIPAAWVAEHRLAGVSSDAHSVWREKTLVNLHCSSDGQLMLIACLDGRVAKLAWEQSSETHSSAGGQWRESVLRPNSFFGRFFGRGGTSNAPSYVSSMATFARTPSWTSTLGFTVSQDQRLRVWDLGSDACIRTIDLPRSLVQSSSSTSLSSERDSSPANADPNDAREALAHDALIRVFTVSEDDASGPYALHLVVLVPAAAPVGSFLACYGIQLDAVSSSSGRQFAGSVGDIDLLWERRCDESVNGSNVELRDMHVITGSQGYWDVWCLWDAAGKTVVKSTRIEEESSTRETQDPSDANGWSTVSLPTSYSPLQGRALDRDLEILEEASDLGPFLLDRITEPGRFSPSSLDQAIKEYEKVLLARNEDPNQLPLAASSHFNIREQILGLVGCTLYLQEDVDTGTPLHEEYFSALKREWAVFLSILSRIDVKHRWPIGFARESPLDLGLENDEGNGPFIVSRGWLSLPVLEDEASRLLRISKAAESERGISGPLSALIRFALDFRQSIDPLALQVFDSSLLHEVVSRPSEVMETLADGLWNEHIRPALDGEEEKFAEEFALLDGDAHSLIRQILLLLRRMEGKPETMERTIGLTELQAGLASDSVTQIIADRLSLASALVLLCAAIKNGLFEQDEDSDFDSLPINDLVVESIVLFHGLKALHFAAHFEGIIEATFSEPRLDEDAIDADSVARKIGQMHVAQTELEPIHLDRAAVNLVHKAVLYQPFQESSDWQEKGLAARITHAATSAISMLMSDDNEEQGARTVELSRTSVEFANLALISGHPSAAKEFVSQFPVTSASNFILARSLLALNDVEEAGDVFDDLLKVFDHWVEERSAFGSGLLDILPASVGDIDDADEAAFQYCRLVVAYFKKARASEQIVRFASRALTRFSQPSTIHGSLQSDSSMYKTRELHLTLFRSYIKMEMYEEAYTSLLANPFEDLQRESLRTLISIMCEGGFVRELLLFNFAGLQAEVERTLSFKARNSDPLSQDSVNYYEILCAFHVQRGDLKSAGATMWQMGTRINDHYRRRLVHARRTAAAGTAFGAAQDDSTELWQFAIIEARCYLASINALSLINEKDAWFAHEVADDEEAKELLESSKLTSYLPADLFQQRPHEVRIVSLEDVRRRYQLLLAQLDLVPLYPDESSAIMTTSRSDASSAVLFFVRSQDYEHAFQLAYNANVDRTQVYISLTDKCLELARWEEIRKERNKEFDDGEAEHPLLQALYDDQDAILGDAFINSDVNDDENTQAPPARFLIDSDRCTSWTGPRSRRAWRYLRLWLSFEDDDGKQRSSVTGAASTDHASQYRFVVLNRILDRQLWRLTPKWLSAWLRSHAHETLITSLMEHGLILAALEESIELVRASTSATSSHVKRRKVGSGKSSIAGQTYLPYLLFDALLKRSEESRAATAADSQQPQAGTLLEQRDAAKTLRHTIETHKERLRAVQKDVRRDLDEDEARRQKSANTALDVEMRS